MTADRIDYRDIPIVINNFNRCRDLLALIGWLQQAEQRNLVILDNLSTLPELDGAYRRFESDGIRVVRLQRNAGARSLWALDLLPQLGIDTPFVYTDSDIVPDEDCPPDLVGHLSATLDANPDFVKVGVGLRIDDLPGHYAKKTQVETWEAQFWRHPVAPGLFLAPVDTTFALYRARSDFALQPALRTGRPYRARHLGWYVDSANLAGEDAFYLARANSDTNWSGGDLPAALAAAIEHERQTRPLLVNFACGDDPLPGWINIGELPGPGIDIVFTAAGTRVQRLPIADDTIDGVFVKWGARSSGPVLSAMQELHRVARSGAKLIMRMNTPRRVPDFSATAYARIVHSYQGDWEIVRRDVVKRGDQSLETIVEWRAVKPSRRPRWAAPRPPPPGILPTPIDPRSTFP
jgi:hypothetical protein